MSKFEELLDQLNRLGDEQAELAKAMPAEDDDEDMVLPPNQENTDAGEGDDNEDTPENEDAGQLTKSAVIEFGGENYLDATETIKSLQMKIDGQEEAFVKSLGGVTGLIEKQNLVIKSLVAQVNKLSNQGRGRKAVLSISEPPAPAGQSVLSKAGPDPNEIMTKALAAQAEGRVTAIDVSRCEIALQSGGAAPADVLARF